MGTITPEEDPEEEYEYEEEGEEEDEGCYSDVLKKYVTRGTTVIHPGTPSKGCKCPDKGNSLVCVELGCGRTMLPTPNVPYPKNMDLRNCFDPWLNREVADGSSYERVRLMTAYQSVTGTYTCSCNLGVIRCRAIDIPCCDSVSKEFKDYGEAVHVDYRGSAVACTCHRGQSAFRNCRFISAVTPTNHRAHKHLGRQQEERPRILQEEDSNALIRSPGEDLTLAILIIDMSTEYLLNVPVQPPKQEPEFCASRDQAKPDP